MKRATLGILAIFLLTFCLTPNAISAIKNGATCPKLGQRQKVISTYYECVRVGKKLVWKSIGAKSEVKTATATPTQSPSPAVTPPPSSSPNQDEAPKKEETKLISPWDTKITMESLIATAETKFSDWWDAHPRESSNFHFYKNPTFDSTNTDWIETSSRLASEKFNYLRSAPFNVILSDTDSWAISVMEKNNIPIPPSRLPCNSPSPAQCSDTKNSFFLIIPKVPAVGSAPADQFIAPAHEYFHLVQGQILQPVRVREDSTMPAWFIEGSANFVGYWIIDKASIASYRSGRLLETNRFYAQQLHAPLSSFTDNNISQNNGLTAGSNPYGIGMVACEYIVASSNFDALLGIFKEMGKGLTFEVAFQNSVKISLSDFYINFEKIREAAGIPQGL
jgi:hypothetical protein